MLCQHFRYVTVHVKLRLKLEPRKRTTLRNGGRFSVVARELQTIVAGLEGVVFREPEPAIVQQAKETVGIMLGLPNASPKPPATAT